ncbi:N-lysine methyltransferase KMT5A-A-like [Sycon ciliatum]|uniref:N-lysine methyltransferase KMT5A-A-like n=1 Tax=Sycon ciliatum TaxID=27933 RepID=UPI0031F67C5D
MPERSSPKVISQRSVTVKQLRTPVSRPKTRRSPLRKRQTKTKEEDMDNSQQDIRKYFRVRGKRKTASELKKIESDKIEEAVLAKQEEGMEIFHCDVKGRAVRAVRPFKRGEFICEYSGELLTHKQGIERERMYNEHPERYGSYMYFFQFKDVSYCLDCTQDNGRLGRLLNHSRRNQNVQTLSIGVQGRACLIFKALRDIEVGEELCYDYGDRNPLNIDRFPWLAQ